MRRFGYVAALGAVCGMGPAMAAPVGFTFNAGPITYIEGFPTDPEIAAYQNYVLGEDMLVSFVMDSAVPDLDLAPGVGPMRISARRSP